MHGKQVCASSAEEMHGDKELGRDRQLSQFELPLAQALSMSLEINISLLDLRRCPQRCLKYIPFQRRYYLLDYRERGFEKADDLCLMRLLRQVLRKIYGLVAWPERPRTVIYQGTSVSAQNDQKPRPYRPHRL